MKKPKWIARQGDVLIERIAKLPENVKKQKANDRIVLALGEATGHHHSLSADPADWWKNDEGEQFLTVREQTQVEHQEHAPITLAPGHYRVLRQREYSPEAIRNVAD